MRKAIALVLALAQLVFGGFLIANGGRIEKSLREQINAVLENGEEFLFALTDFAYDRNEEYGSPLWFRLACPDDYYDAAYGYNWVYPVTADENGVAVFGGRVQDPATDIYYAPYNGEHIEIGKKTFNTVFAGQKDDYAYYAYDDRYPGRSLFKIGDEWKSVYLIGTVWKGDLVVTGLMVDGVRY